MYKKRNTRFLGLRTAKSSQVRIGGHYGGESGNGMRPSSKKTVKLCAKSIQYQIKLDYKGIQVDLESISM